MTRAAVHLLRDDTVLPEPQTVHWVDTSILPLDDPVLAAVVARFAP